jgi:glycoprotein-N-acetylgalactosamine 3-beta-galactosyltransferase
VTIGIPEPTHALCRGDDDGAEDVEMGKCLQNLNVTAGDSRDSSGRARFFALNPSSIVVPVSKDPEFWYWKNQFYPADDGENCCSETTIAFHYVDPHQMYVLDFFAYRLRVFGL